MFGVLHIQLDETRYPLVPINVLKKTIFDNIIKIIRQALLELIARFTQVSPLIKPCFYLLGTALLYAECECCNWCLYHTT